MAEFAEQYEVESDDEQNKKEGASGGGKGVIIDTMQGRKDKSLTLKQLHSLLTKNGLELYLVDYDLTDLNVLEPVL